MTARVEGGRAEMVDAKADSSGISWTVAMVVGVAGVQELQELQECKGAGVQECREEEA